MNFVILHPTQVEVKVLASLSLSLPHPDCKKQEISTHLAISVYKNASILSQSMPTSVHLSQIQIVPRFATASAWLTIKRVILILRERLSERQSNSSHSMPTTVMFWDNYWQIGVNLRAVWEDTLNWPHHTSRHGIIGGCFMINWESLRKRAMILSKSLCACRLFIPHAITLVFCTLSSSSGMKRDGSSRKSLRLNLNMLTFIVISQKSTQIDIIVWPRQSTTYSMLSSTNQVIQMLALSLVSFTPKIDTPDQNPATRR